MPYEISLDKMSIEEKLQTMEALWDDLCHSADSLRSPDWHHTILDERENAVREKQDEFIEWESAKQDIKNNLK